MADVRSEHPVTNDARAIRVHEAIHSKRMEGIHSAPLPRASSTVRTSDRPDVARPARDR